MSLFSSTGWKLKRITAGQEELDSNNLFNSTSSFDLQQNTSTSLTAKADRKTFTTIDNHAFFEFEIPRNILSSAQIAVIEKLNLTSVIFWPYADNESFSFECIVQVQPLRPFSGWRAIDIYKITIRSKKEVIIDTSITVGIAGWSFIPDAGATPTKDGIAGYDELTEL